MRTRTIRRRDLVAGPGKSRSGEAVYLNEPISARRAVALVVAVVLGVLLLPVGVQAAAPALVQLIDGAGGTSKARVDAGKVRVGDGEGALTVNGQITVGNKVTVGNTAAAPVQAVLKPGVLLANGYCPPSGTVTDMLQPGEVVTSIVFTGSTKQYPGARLDIFPMSDPADHTKALMSLKTYGGSGNVGEQNAVYASDVGFKVTGDWSIVCGGPVDSVGHNGALYSVFGYPAP